MKKLITYSFFSILLFHALAIKALNKPEEKALAEKNAFCKAYEKFATRAETRMVCEDTEKKVNEDVLGVFYSDLYYLKTGEILPYVDPSIFDRHRKTVSPEQFHHFVNLALAISDHLEAKYEDEKPFKSQLEKLLNK